MKQKNDVMQSTLLKITVASLRDWEGVGTGVQPGNAGGLDHGRNGQTRETIEGRSHMTS